MRVLILGGTGTISTGIVTELLARGTEVVLLHRSAGVEGDGVTHVVGSRDSEDDLRGALAHGPFDAVIDMICFRPEQARLAIAVFGGQVPQFVFCSTVDVYSKQVDAYPLTESAERSAVPSFPYAFDKVACELEFERAAAQGAFGLTIIRPAATYVNSAVAPMGTYPLSVERLRAGLPLLLHGDGSSIWTVAHRDDVAVAFVNALGNPEAIGRAFHAAGEELLTWNSYWRLAAAGMGFDAPEFIHIPTDVLGRLSPERASWCVENFQYDNIFDNAAARDVLGYEYRTTWAQGARSLRTEFDEPVAADVRRDYEALLQRWDTMNAAVEPIEEGAV